MRSFYSKVCLIVCLAFCLSSCSREPDPELGSMVPPTTSTAAAGSPADHFDWAQMQDFWTRSMALSGVDTGPADSTKHMLVYFDPYCPTCARQWLVIKPYIQTVRIRWIPIAFMSKDSERCAAAILASADPAAALVQNEDGYDFSKRAGDCPPTPLASIPSWAIQKVRDNTRSSVAKQYVSGTPVVGFELYNGGGFNFEAQRV